MTTFRRQIQIVLLTMVALILFAGAALSPASAQARYESVYNGHRIFYPESSIPWPGRHHTNYFFVDSDRPTSNPDPGDETPGSVACVYKLVAGPTGCPIATSTTVPNGGIGAIAIVDAGYYPTAQSDLNAFDSYFGIPATTLTQVWPGAANRPPVYPDWEVEEAFGYRVGSRHGAARQAVPGGLDVVSNPAMRDRSHLGSGAARRKSGGGERRRRGEHELWRCGDCSGA